MKSILALILLINANLFSQQSPAFKTEFELSNGLKSATYQQTIDFYQKLAKTYPEITFKTLGLTDSGFPLNLVIFNADKEFDFDKINQSNKNVILINNGIHPGEPDGIDASMMLLRDIVQDKNLKNSFQNIVIAVIPVYNIGGALNRNSTTRVNQNGPLEYGFRGNARNFDLNRDFIKNDTKNAQSFSKLFHLL
ncbi:MAG: M14 family metallopeptidase, partial [Zetaproteobacteria bacterium]|nr:M14 family metallopeptidase [Flavobacteriales bacterium]